MKRSSIASRTIIISTTIVSIAIIGIYFLFSWFSNANRIRTFNDRAKLELNSIHLIVNDSYTMGDLIGLRKSLDTFSSLNAWKAGILTDIQGGVLWQLNTPNLKYSSPNVKVYASDIKTDSGGTLANLKIIKDQSLEIEKWDQQFLSSLIGMAIISIILLIVQYITLSKILMPITELTKELQHEAKKMNITLSRESDEDEIYQVKKWFLDVAYSWKLERENAAKQSKLRAIGELASQVAHDIRSPLSALSVVNSQLDTAPELLRELAKSAIERISDIANSLIIKSREALHEATYENKDSSLDSLTTHYLPPFVKAIISEKRIQFQKKNSIVFKIDGDNEVNLYAKVDPTDFKCIISNLVNNAIEALPEGCGTIEITFKKIDKLLYVSINDNGVGIPDEIFKKLGQAGVTNGKKGAQSGTGLGIYHAKKTIEAWGGKFDIKTKKDVGTSITIALLTS